MPLLSRRRLFQLSGAAALAAATPVMGRDLSPADLRGDVAILRRVWETMHPGLYRYSTPDQITAAGWAGRGLGRPGIVP